jgi:hypothetical protein
MITLWAIGIWTWQNGSRLAVATGRPTASTQ